MISPKCNSFFYAKRCLKEPEWHARFPIVNFQHIHLTRDELDILLILDKELII